MISIQRLGLVTTAAALFALGFQAREAFDVASIKPKGPFHPSVVGIEHLPGGVMRGTNALIYMMIMDAFDISPRQLDLKAVDGPLLQEMYDFEAKAGANALPISAPAKERDQQLRRMLQTLLAEQFKFAYHKEQRDLPLYALVVAPGGPKFKAVAEGKCPQAKPDDPFTARFGSSCGHLAGGPASGVKGFNVDIANLIETLIDFGDRQVVDRTGIQGRFDVDLPPWTRTLVQAPNDGREPAYEDPNNPTIFALLQQKLGLRLESTRGSVDIYVIDHVEAPTPN